MNAERKVSANVCQLFNIQGMRHENNSLPLNPIIHQSFAVNKSAIVLPDR